MPEKEEKLRGRLRDLSSVMGSNFDLENSTNESEVEEKSDSNIDSYIIGDAIAVGGQKIIYNARDRRSGRNVAMARLKEEFTTPKNRERFLREARTLAKLEHSSIVPIHEINENQSGDLFFTMKLLSGETLASIIKKIRKGDPDYQRKFSQTKLLDIFIRICDAISYTHSNNIVHLDIKPENIQVSDFGEVLIMDWGMAKHIDEDSGSIYSETDLPSFIPLSENVTLDGNISGTPGYMSPEQARSEKRNLREASDIYSLGALLYSIIYFQPPYHRMKVELILEKTSQGEPPEFPKKSKFHNIPSTLRAIVIKAMKPNPDERYENTISLQRDIYNYQHDFATQAENINLLKLSRLFIKRHSKALAVLLTSLAIITSVLIYSYIEVKKREEVLQAQNLKVTATADEIIAGTLKKHELMREKNQYAEIIDNYKKLHSVGYNYPEFWYDEARLYVGEMNYKKAFFYLDKVSESDSPVKDSEEFNSLNNCIFNALKLSLEGKLDHKNIMIVTQLTDIETQKQVMWNLNRAENIPLSERLDNMGKALNYYNHNIDEEDFHFEFSTENNYIKVDLSNNSDLTQALPLYGMPINELDASKTQIRLGHVYPFLKKKLKVLNLSNIGAHITNALTIDSAFEKLIVRNTLYSADRLDDIPNLKYLDIEGVIIRAPVFKPNPKLEYLNIAYTYMTDFKFLIHCTSLKTLILDRSMTLPNDVSHALNSREVEILYKEIEIPEIPNKVEAENFIKISGVNTKLASDIGGTMFLGWWEPGDFAKYDLQVNRSGKYKVTFRLAGKKFHFRLQTNDDKILVDVDERGTTGWQDWKSIHKEVELQAGKRTLILKCLGPGWNINWMDFEFIE